MQECNLRNNVDCGSIRWFLHFALVFSSNFKIEESKDKKWNDIVNWLIYELFDVECNPNHEHIRNLRKISDHFHCVA